MFMYELFFPCTKKSIPMKNVGSFKMATLRLLMGSVEGFFSDAHTLTSTEELFMMMMTTRRLL